MKYTFKMSKINKFSALYRGEESALEVIFNARLKNTPDDECPGCGKPINETYQLDLEEKLSRCSDCWTVARILTGTVFEGTHAPLGKWFNALDLIRETQGRVIYNKKELVLELKGSYKTFSRMTNKLEPKLTDILSGPSQFLRSLPKLKFKISTIKNFHHE